MPSPWPSGQLGSSYYVSHEPPSTPKNGPYSAILYRRINRKLKLPKWKLPQHDLGKEEPSLGFLKGPATKILEFLGTNNHSDSSICDLQTIWVLAPNKRDQLAHVCIGDLQFWNRIIFGYHVQSFRLSNSEVLGLRCLLCYGRRSCNPLLPTFENLGWCECSGFTQIYIRSRQPRFQVLNPRPEPYFDPRVG